MRVLVFLSVASCWASSAAPTEAPRPSDRAPPRVTVEQVIAALEACTSPLPPNTNATISRRDHRWSVRALDRSVTIDLAAASCDGKPIHVEPPRNGHPIDDVIATAGACAKGPPWNGKGTGASPLVWETPTVVVRHGERLAVAYDELEPHTKPQGAELDVDLGTGACEPVARD